jgi:hypothetical protein
MTFPFALGLLVVALGAAGLLVAWLHPSPRTLRFVKVLSWPRQARDRTSLALVSLSAVAVGAFLVLNTPGRDWFWLAVCGVVLAGAGMALALGRTAA